MWHLYTLFNNIAAIYGTSIHLLASLFMDLFCVFIYLSFYKRLKEFTSTYTRHQT